MEDLDKYEFVMMTKSEMDGSKPIQGYFSKKRTNEWSLNSIFVFYHQGKGKQLNALSYLILKEKGKVGSPEGPLSGREFLLLGGRELLSSFGGARCYTSSSKVEKTKPSFAFRTSVSQPESDICNSLRSMKLTQAN